MLGRDKKHWLCIAQPKSKCSPSFFSLHCLPHKIYCEPHQHRNTHVASFLRLSINPGRLRLLPWLLKSFLALFLISRTSPPEALSRVICLETVNKHATCKHAWSSPFLFRKNLKEFNLKEYEEFSFTFFTVILLSIRSWDQLKLYKNYYMLEHICKLTSSCALLML